MSVSLVPEGIADGGSTRIIVNNDKITLANNQDDTSSMGGQIYHAPVTGYLPREWGNFTLSAYSTVTVSNHGASGSTSWTSSDDPGSPMSTICLVSMDAGHTREMWALHVHCCRVSYTKLAGVSTYATTSFSSSTTNTGPYTFSWSGANFAGHSVVLKFFSVLS